MIINHPLQLEFTIEKGMNQAEIETLWKQTQQSQKQIDNFLSGQCSDSDLCEFLACNGIDPDVMSRIFNGNLDFLRKNA